MISVEVRNYQSIESIAIQIDGFTALVGRSNIGKSALVRALKTALTNELGTSFVRHDRTTCGRLRGLKTCKCFTSVHIQREGFDLLWEKGDAINRYTFNGQQYDKPGVGFPDFLQSSGLTPVKIGDNLESLQVADQFSPIFLLNQSGPAAAEALSDVARLDKISAAMKLAERDRREAQSTRKVRLQDITALGEKLSTYDGLEKACSRADKTEASLSEIDARCSCIEDLGTFVAAVQSLAPEVNSLVSVVGVKIPSNEGILGSWGQVQVLAGLQGQLLSVGSTYRRLLSTQIPDLPEVGEVTNRLAQTRALCRWVSKVRAFQGAFAKLEAVELPTLLFDPAVTLRSEATRLSSYSARLAAIAGSILQLEKESSDLEAEGIEVQREVDLLGLCPTCNQPVGHAHA